MINIKTFLIFYILFLINSAYAKEGLLKFIENKKEFSIFYKLIKVAKYEDLFNQKTQFKKIIYIPNNQAFQKLPNKIKDKIMEEEIAKKIIRTHLYSGEVKEVFKDPKKKVVILE